MRNAKRKLAIRDDDLCGLTDWEEVRVVYEPLWNNISVSFSVIPFVGAPLPFRGQPPLAAPLPVGENCKVVENLRRLLQAGRAGINLHGYDHTYVVRDGMYQAEYWWKSEAQLCKQTIEGKMYLEGVFGTRVRVFVPPSNSISRAGIAAVERAGLHMSAVIGKGGDRPMSVSYLRAYALKYVYRSLTGFPYPYPLRVGNHLELAYYTLTRVASIDRLRKALEFCYRRDAPFVLAVHYWELCRDEQLRAVFYELVGEALRRGFEPVPLAECFDER